jgi:hypothetical protein
VFLHRAKSQDAKWRVEEFMYGLRAVLPIWNAVRVLFALDATR